MSVDAATASAESFTREEITVDGLNVRVGRTAPQERTVLYLHSGTGELGPIPFFGELAKHGVGAIIPEIPGFGKSEYSPIWDRIEDYVYFLRRTLHALNPGPIDVMGASLGGWMAAELAVWFPEAVASLTLCNPVGLFVDGEGVPDAFGSPGGTQEEFMARGNPHGYDLMADLACVVEGSDDPQALMLHFLKASEAGARIGWNPPYLYDRKLLDRLPSVTVPTQVLWGRDDRLAPERIGRAYVDAIPGARLVLIDGCGHSPVFEKAELTAAKVAELIGVPDKRPS